MQLLLDLLAQPVHGGLHDAVEQQPLQVAEHRRADVDGEADEKDVAQRREVDAGSGMQRHRREEVGALVVARGAQLRDDLLLRDARDRSSRCRAASARPR